MTKKQKKKQIRKKKMIVIAFFLMLLFVLSAITTVTIVNMTNKTEEENNKEDVLQYIEEKDENNVILANLDDKKEEEQNEEEQNQENENIQTTENNDKKETNSNEPDIPYYIKVNNKANVVTVYKKDKNGNYTVPYKAMLCSVGDYTPPCDKYPDRIYQIPTVKNTRFVWAQMQGGVYAQYATRIVKNILFHSVPYTKGWNTDAKGSLEWEEYDKLGTRASLGCVRLTVQDAKWIYDNCVGGTTVEFYEDDNPGPLGKPTARKISNDEEVRGWDPTDPDKKNPWPEYLKKKEEAAKEAEKAKNTQKTQETSTKPTENKVETNKNSINNTTN